MDATRARTPRRLRMGSLVGAAALLGVLAFPASATGAPDGADDAALVPCEVSLTGFRFSPADCTISAGETVTWTHNQPGATHTVTSDNVPAAWTDSGFMSAGQTFGPVTLTEPGDYPYHCRVHPDVMKGVIHVS